jgi:hypothetical protein
VGVAHGRRVWYNALETAPELLHACVRHHHALGPDVRGLLHHRVEESEVVTVLKYDKNKRTPCDASLEKVGIPVRRVRSVCVRVCVCLCVSVCVVGVWWVGGGGGGGGYSLLVHCILRGLEAECDGDTLKAKSTSKKS